MLENVKLKGHFIMLSVKKLTQTDFDTEAFKDPYSIEAETFPLNFIRFNR